MIFILMQLDGCIVILIFFQEKYGIHLYVKNKIKTVEETTNEQGMWIFVDTECRVEKKVTFTWNSLFQAFQDKEFQMLL